MRRNAAGDGWVTTDTAYVRTPASRRVPFRSPTVPGLYTLGCHNERHELAFTSIEAATHNTLLLCEELDPRSVAHEALRGYRADRICTLNAAIGSVCVVLGGLAVAAAVAPRSWSAAGPPARARSWSAARSS